MANYEFLSSAMKGRLLFFRDKKVLSHSAMGMGSGGEILKFFYSRGISINNFFPVIKLIS